MHRIWEQNILLYCISETEVEIIAENNLTPTSSETNQEKVCDLV